MGKNGVQMWNLKTGSLKTPLPYKGKQGVSALAFSPDGQTLVSNSYDSVIDPKNTNPNPMFRRKNISNIEIWNLSTGKLKTAFPSEEGLLNLVAISSDGKTVVSRP
jgi:WD40 repeat protein